MPRKARSTKPMVTTIPITKARINLGALVRRVHLNKEYFVIEKDGIPIAGLMDIDEFEDYLELQDPKVSGPHRQRPSGVSCWQKPSRRRTPSRTPNPKDRESHTASATMTSPFSVRTIPQFDRLFRRLERQHPDFPDIYWECLRSTSSH